ncbi:MAG: ABC transporter substrate-binding protein [Lachnospiraceae bacterium]|nr:ABC transporter substrate-binding protein [Lachnospiraceae bacterium]
MKRYVAMLLAAVTVCFAVGCGGATNTGSGASEKVAGGQIAIGSTTQMSGDWETIWTNNGADSDVLRLISGYSVVAQTKDGDYVWDETVLKDVKETVREDGSKTFAFTLNDNLFWNDGIPVTAKDYLWFFAAFSNKERAAAFELSGNEGKDYVGHGTYFDGSAPVFAGLRLLDINRFSVTVAAENLPYYYEKLMVNLTPYPMHVWLPADVELLDAGDGIYLSENATAEYIKASVKAARWDSEDRVSCGPYVLKSFDSSAGATLTVNPYYAGNYEGQKPGIANVFYRNVENGTQFDMLRAGQVDVISGITEGMEIDAALALAKEGGFDTVSYPRNGYGKLMFVCDFGPTQFAEVRRAMAHLLNRRALVDRLCGGYGAVVNGPYGLGMSMYKDAKDELENRLNSYSYSLKKAVRELENGGWVYGVDGRAYESGIRYKSVKKEQTVGYEDKIVRLADGRILMPLIIEWLSSENNAMSELLDELLVQGETTAAAGLQINRTTVEFAELQNWVKRDASQGVQYEIPTYNMFNLANDFDVSYDESYQWTRDEELIAYGYNVQRLADEELDRLSMDMVYGVEAGDEEHYLELWVEYVVRYNEILPEIPLYSNIYYDVFRENVRGYEVNSFRNAADAILYCTVEE